MLCILGFVWLIILHFFAWI